MKIQNFIILFSGAFVATLSPQAIAQTTAGPQPKNGTIPGHNFPLQISLPEHTEPNS